MDIKNIPPQLHSQLTEANSADSGEKISKTFSQKNESVYSDKVSLNEQVKLKNEKIFAKVELSKLDHNAFEKLKTLKAKITEFELAKNESASAAAQTEIGTMLNDPSVWDDIAKKILE